MRARPAEVRSRQVALPNLAATEALARRLAKLARPGDVIGLAGDLGAGKTTLIRVWHLDLYRLNAPADAFELGIEDAFADGISLIEWPDRLGALLPDDWLEVRLSTTGSGEARRAELVAHGTWRERIEAMVDDG
jgi:tRNA threonylcarbamoyladenosine biosynthesis protein TsaE